MTGGAAPSPHASPERDAVPPRPRAVDVVLPVDVVLLTMNDRPGQERAAQAAPAARRGVVPRDRVVGNGRVAADARTVS
ncbi:hypothetical protein ACFVWY_16625 [Streptomyces sp. NPDC058195]|uniref:hypothetical protein n=1 Tax=Streptomyces sp. NPDC058195 TaxID=3346375 RepID=UPI0036ED703A